nr:hypothetical protein I308_01982 [Cryptococcus tetragattii IND107]
MSTGGYTKSHERQRCKSTSLYYYVSVHSLPIRKWFLCLTKAQNVVQKVPDWTATGPQRVE